MDMHMYMYMQHVDMFGHTSQHATARAEAISLHLVIAGEAQRNHADCPASFRRASADLVGYGVVACGPASTWKPWIYAHGRRAANPVAGGALAAQAG